jgi:hypothetical protein
MTNEKVYGPLTLPSGKEVFFRKPLRKDRNEAMVAADFENKVYGLALIDVEEYIKAQCLVKVDGKEPELNYTKTFDSWDDQDVQYYATVFDHMFGMTKEKQDDAAEKAAFLLKSLTSTAGSNLTDESVTTNG